MFYAEDVFICSVAYVAPVLTLFTLVEQIIADRLYTHTKIIKK